MDLSKIQLPPVTVTVDDNSLRNIFIVIMLAGVSLMVTYKVLFNN